MKTPAQHPFWYQALSLKERLQPQLRTKRAANVERGKRRLARWCAQAPFVTGDLFEHRLAAVGVSRDELVDLLGEVVEPALERCAEPPAWVLALRESFSHSTQQLRLALPSRWRNLVGREFWDLVEPIVRRAFTQLAASLEELSRAHPRAPVRSEAIAGVLMSSLPHELLDWPLRVLVLELNVARLQGELKAEGTRGRFHEFTGRLRDPETALGLLQEYPVLARQLVACVETWSRTTHELLERLCRDWPLITRTFLGCDSSDALIDLHVGAGDRHRDGRSVAILRFRSGFKLLYKPRSLSIDTHFQQLLRTLNEWGEHPPLRTIGVLERDSYGWMEHITAQECSSLADVRRFYQRQGGYLALLYMLRATDIHFENIIAAGEHPVPVDLESILQPGPPHEDFLAGDVLRDSIVQVGLLPVRNWENEASPGLDVSGLGGPDGQLPPRPEPYWADQATDRMHSARDSRQITSRGRHRPALNGEPLRALDYSDEIAAGFQSTYQLLLAHREELLAEGGPLSLFAGQEVRVLLRSTAVYGLMLRESFHPDFLRDGLDRDRFFDKLWLQVPRRPFLRRVIGDEQESLWQGDIPRFAVLPDTRALRSSSGEVLDDFFTKSGMDLVRERLQGFGESDLSRQVWFIRASMAILSDKSPEREGRPDQRASPPPAASGSREGLERLTARIGDCLCDSSMQDESSIRWLGLLPTRQRAYKIALLGGDLYSGQSGVTLFLAYLGSTSGEEKYTRLAQKSCRTLLQLLEQEPDVLSRVGAFEGLGGVIYLLCHVAALWDQPSLLDEALRLVDRIHQLFAAQAEDGLDVMTGSAGCILALSALYRSRPAEAVLQAMLRCGDRVVQGAVRTPQGIGWITTGEVEVPLTGFSHGTSGIAVALLELAALSGQSRFRTAALEALLYERSLFSPEHGNWPDLRLGDNRFTQVNWCHGAPGIGLARIMISRHEASPEVREEIEVAVRTTLAHGFGRNHSLCHGDLGNMDLLLAADSCVPGLELAEDIDRLTATIIADVEHSGWRCGLPEGVETPGLMTGLAGIGYGVLRLAAPERVPSVLMLEPPEAASGH